MKIRSNLTFVFDVVVVVAVLVVVDDNVDVVKNAL